jgi:diguanylate cyclase (GGDEF)-like protein
MPGVRPVSETDEWALIRYIGAPIGEVIPIGPEGIVIGRTAESRVYLPEPEVSRRHAKLELISAEGGPPMVHLLDMGSTNGTFVNGHRLDSQGVVVIKDGDVIRVGGHAFKLKRLDELEQHYHRALVVQTTQDALTGVYNRATVLAYLEKHVDWARRYYRALSLILCDLDHFKNINDTYGHAAGDQVLRIFGLLTMGRLRSSDMVGRIGGEEFLVVLPETPGSEATSVAEQLRGAIFDERVIPPGGGDPFPVTCSYGVAQLNETDSDAGSLLARADVALYRAKAQGRNRVEADLPCAGAE